MEEKVLSSCELKDLKKTRKLEKKTKRKDKRAKSKKSSKSSKPKAKIETSKVFVIKVSGGYTSECGEVLCVSK